MPNHCLDIEKYLQSISISQVPRSHLRMGKLLELSYRLPHRTNIKLEGVEHIPTHQSVMFAMNHTDRYNYWPFQLALLRAQHPRFTLCWVKGKYYEHKPLAWVLNHCNNLPLPSLGYIILKEATAVLKKRLAPVPYRLLRNLCDQKLQLEELTSQQHSSIAPLLAKQRYDFNPQQETYPKYILRTHARLMALLEKRTLEAIHDKNNHIIVFPQGTRSQRLLPAHTGMMQFALRHQLTIVPVGCNGSDEVYPGPSPWASGGNIVYRIGKPMTIHDTLSDCAITEEFIPFSPQAKRFSAQFTKAAALVTDAINPLLDPMYQIEQHKTSQQKQSNHVLL